MLDSSKPLEVNLTIRSNPLEWIVHVEVKRTMKGTKEALKITIITKVVIVNSVTSCQYLFKIAC